MSPRDPAARRPLAASRRCRVALVCAALLAIASGAAGDPEAFDPFLAEMGGAYFVQHCAACHGVDARGEGPAAGALRTRPADLTTIAARRGGHFPAGEISRTIDGRLEVAAHGSREMPVWGQRLGEGFGDEGIAEEIVRGRLVMLVEYLKSIQRRAYLEPSARGSGED